MLCEGHQLDNYSDQTVWVVDADLDLYNNSCPLPRWNRRPPFHRGHRLRRIDVELAPDTDWWATFVNCSQVIKSNGMYRPVACMSKSYAFVYVLSGLYSYNMENLEPSCGYLAMTPLGGPGTMLQWNANLSYTIKLMRNGFAVRFPFTPPDWTGIIKRCLAEWIDYFREKPTSSAGIKDRIGDILFIDISFLGCVTAELARRSPVLCRFVLMPLAVLIFLAHKYWRTRITIDAVEKFLRMQQMLGPTRYAYTDITAITSHFRDVVGAAHRPHGTGDNPKNLRLRGGLAGVTTRGPRRVPRPPRRSVRRLRGCTRRHPGECPEGPGGVPGPREGPEAPPRA